MTPPADPSVSLLARLRHLAQQQGLAPGSMLLLYAQQGFLARLDASEYAEQFVVKGGLSLFARYRAAARPTQDLDLAASGLPNTPEAMTEALRTVVAIDIPDGLTFDTDAISARVMQLESRYSGVAAQVTAQVGRARQTLPLDISFGNVITPAPVHLTFPRLLLPEAVPMRVYPLESVVAEKYAALLELGLLTTRMKDLYDLWVISRREVFQAATLRQAISRSLHARGTPPASTVLTPDFARDAVLAERWRAYLRRTGLSAEAEFVDVMTALKKFLLPVSDGASEIHTGAQIWHPERERWE